MTRIEVSTGEDAQQARAGRAVLAAFEAGQGWPVAPASLRVLPRDAEGAILGGLTAAANRRWLWVTTPALPPALRGRGLGRRLLAAAQAEALAQGCVGVRLDTHSFQARGFDKKQGDREGGRIEDRPPGHVRYTMIKRLDGAPREQG